MAVIALNQDEEECARFLAARFDEGNRRFRIDELPSHLRLGEQATMAIVDRFENFHWVEWESNVTLSIRGKLLNELEPLLHPAPKDYWHAIAVWFRSRWWSVPVFVVLVALPLLVQWIEMIGKLLTWLRLAQ